MFCSRLTAGPCLGRSTLNKPIGEYENTCAYDRDDQLAKNTRQCFAKKGVENEVADQRPKYSKNNVHFAQAGLFNQRPGGMSALCGGRIWQARLLQCLLPLLSLSRNRQRSNR